MPLAVIETSDQGTMPVPVNPPVIPLQTDRPVAIPVRKSLRGLVPKKMFPIEMTGACAGHFHLLRCYQRIPQRPY